MTGRNRKNKNLAGLQSLPRCTMQASGEHTQASSIYKIYQSLCNISVSVSQCNISVSVFRIYTGSLDFVGSSTGSAAFQEVDISMYTPAIIEKFPDSKQYIYSTHIYHLASVSIYIFFNISVCLKVPTKLPIIQVPYLRVLIKAIDCKN